MAGNLKMNQERLKKYLGKVSMHLFAEYFDLFMNKNISNHDIALKIFNEYRYSDKSCCSRTGHARMIINEGGAESALNLIMNSNATVEATRQIAKKHIEKYFINHDNLDLL